MSIFLFNKPKQTIRNILFFIGLVSILLTFLAISSIVLWKYYPGVVYKIDMKIPDFYSNNLNKLYIKAQNKKDYQKQVEYYEKLYNELIECSTLNKYYKYRQESASFLIDHYLKNNQYLKALEIASLWEKMYPYDFSGKFKYAEVLETNNKHDALKYYASLYKKHDDMPTVIYKYIELLKEVKETERANEIRLKADLLMKKEVEFKVFYQDNREYFAEDQTIVIDHFDYLNEGNMYTFNIKKTFYKFNGLRLDIEKTPLLFNIYDLKVILNNDNTKHELEIKTAHHMEKENNSYRISGDDPFFIFSVPKKFLGNKKNLEFTVSIGLKSNE